MDNNQVIKHGETSITPLYDGKKRCSIVWKFFGRLLINEKSVDETHFYCSLCLQEGIISSKYRYSGISTSGMMNHLRNSHKIINEKEIESSLKRTKGLVDRSFILQDKKASKALFTRRTALMMCRTLMPFSILDNEGFKDWMLNNHFVENVDDIPYKSSVLNSALNDVYNSAESLMKKELFAASKVITLQLDYYTSANGCVPYITIAVQYLNENFEMVTFTLATEKFDRPHSALRTGEKVENVLESFGLHDRIIIGSGDHGSNLMKLTSTVDNCVKYIDCVGHSLHLTFTTDLLKCNSWGNIGKVLQKIKATHGAVCYQLYNLKSYFLQQQRTEILEYLNEIEELIEPLNTRPILNVFFNLQKRREK